MVDPPDSRAVTGSDEFLHVEVPLACRGEEPDEERAHLVRAAVPLTVGWLGTVEHAVLGHRGDDGVDVASVDRVVEPLDRLAGRDVGGHLSVRGHGRAS